MGMMVCKSYFANYLSASPSAIFPRPILVRPSGRKSIRSANKNHAIFLKLEPDLWNNQLPDTSHLKPGTSHLKLDTSPHNIQPPRTILVDLAAPEDEILARMKQKTRYNIRLAEKKGVTVRPWDDLSAFHDMMLVTGDRDGFGVHSEKYYRRAYELLHPKGMCEILLAEYEGKPLAALFVACHGNRAYYLYGASTDEERNRMPTYLLQWEAMQWAKARGCEEYDLWGVPDEDEETWKQISNRAMMACGVSTVSSADLEVSSSGRPRQWIESIILCYIRYIYKPCEIENNLDTRASGIRSSRNFPIHTFSRLTNGDR